MPVPSEWIEHRRGRDAELVGWIVPQDDDFVAIDLLGRAMTAPIGWLEAEDILESTGIGYLADAYELRQVDGSWLRVRIVEVSPAAIRVKKEDWGAIDAPWLEFTLPFPAPDSLRIHQLR